MSDVLEKIPEELRGEVQAEINRVAGNVRQEVKEKFADYETLKEKSAKIDQLQAEYDQVKVKLDALDAKEKERKKASQTKLEQIESELQEARNALTEKTTLAETLQAQYEAVNGELETAKAYREQREAAEKASVEKAMADLSEDDKSLVEKLPLDQQMAFINRLKAQKPGAGVPPDKPTPKKGKDFYSREEVAGMTREEVRTNLKVINASMAKWK